MSRIGYRLINEHCERVRPPRADVPAKTVILPLPKGAKRELFLCPGCGDRYLYLYHVHGRWACRQCHKLAYRSENSDKAQRLWLQQQKGKPITKRMRRLANS